MPCSTFYDNSIPYTEVQRIGGLQSHLLRIYQDIVLQEISKEKASSEDDSLAFGIFFSFENFLEHLLQFSMRF